jgi:hypothetical protein
MSLSHLLYTSQAGPRLSEAQRLAIHTTSQAHNQQRQVARLSGANH